MTQSFPWYDSPWLACYARVRAWLQRHRPERLARLEEIVAPLRTPPDFEVIEIDRLLPPGDFDELLGHLEGLSPPSIDPYEISSFGRVVVWDDPVFTRLQERLVPRVSELVGEAVTPSYNFLSCYTAMGRCEVHMDAPFAKWTLDICLRQSRPWPIHFSQVVPWPVEHGYGADWENEVRADPDLSFTEYVMEPGQALLFAGSSQWHFRDPLPRESHADFCDLLFLHYIPAGTERALDPATWPGLLDIPELDSVIDPEVSRRRQTGS